jgi:hypothetical protein
MSRIFDCFRFFNEKEILELRYLMLKDKVEKFIILEGNKTQSGDEWTPVAESIIDKLGYPKDKFIFIKSDLPDNNEIMKRNYSNNPLTNTIDHILSSKYLSSNPQTIHNFTRERLVLDSLLNIIHIFEDTDLLFVSDCDEIITKNHLDYFATTCINYPESLIKVPLVELQGQADFRAYTKNNIPIFNDQSAYICTKKHLLRCSPTQLKYIIDIPFNIVFITENGERLQDCGWHFSWMGDSQHKKIKAKSFSLCDQNVDSDIISFRNIKADHFFDIWKPCEGGPNPWNDRNVVLKKYPIDKLPSEIFTSYNIKKFFLGDDQKIPIIGVPIVNGVHWLERLINSIDYPVKELCIINNNGRDQITNDLNILCDKKYDFIDKIRILNMPSNIGVVASWNLIIKSYIMSSYWLFCNNDISFTPGFLKSTVEESLQDETLGVISSASEESDSAHISFACFLIKDWVIDKCGLFDENFYPAYYEDIDYYLKLKKNNIKTKSLDIRIYHGDGLGYESGSQTLKSEADDVYQKINKACCINQEYIFKVWGNNYQDQFHGKINISDPAYIPYLLNENRKKYLGF